MTPQPLLKNLESNQALSRLALARSKSVNTERNKMKRIGYLFEKLIDKDNLRLALKNASKGKSKYAIVKRIEKNPERYVEKLYSLLITNTYESAGYKSKFIFDKGKIREIKKTRFFPDRVLHHAIIQILNPILNKHFITHTYQSIKGRGVHRAIRYASKPITNPDIEYALIVDITKFYPSVNNKLLMAMFERKIKDRKMLDIIGKIIYSTEGLPIGNYTSQPFGNFMLSGFDHYAKEVLGLKYYVRYADDILVLAENKEILHSARIAFTEQLAYYGLKVKPNYQVFDISKRPPDYLGYILTPSGIKLRKRIKHKFISLMKKNCWNQTRINALVSYLGWLQHANTKRLRAKYFTKEVKEALKQYGVITTLPSCIRKELNESF